MFSLFFIRYTDYIDKKHGTCEEREKKNMKKRFVALTMAALLSFSLAACGSGDSSSDDAGSSSGSDSSEEGGSFDVANKDKPLVWFNRQPSSMVSAPGLNVREW